MTTILPATREHVDRLLSLGLCADDARAFEAAGTSPEAAVRNAFEASTKAWTLLDVDGEPVAIWGVAPWPGQTGVGAPWFAASNAVRNYALTLRRRAKEFILEMGREFTVLSNFIDARHRDAIGWLRDVGFRFDTAATAVGPDRASFIQFGIRVASLQPHTATRN